jgi:hypothetical protein
MNRAVLVKVVDDVEANILPSRSRIKGAGTVPLMPIALDTRPSIIIVCRAIRSVISFPVTVGRDLVSPGEFVCAHAGM